jgi:hypothetical protein
VGIFKGNEVKILSFIKYNPNPANKETGDCVVRALAVAEGLTWDAAFQGVTQKAFREKDMPSMNPVWANYLIERGYILHGIPNTCPRCYTVADFAYDHPYGTYVLGTGSHAIAVIDGNYIDAWDSGDITPMYYLAKGENQNGSQSVPNTTNTIVRQPAVSNAAGATATTAIQ